jgi:hypothetical protein
MTRIANPRYAARRTARRQRPVYAKLPAAPRTGSPVPRLTSLYHYDETGPNSERRSYPGNCPAMLVRNLLTFFAPASVFDPMSGSGTCRDACESLAIPCVSLDLKSGFDACEPAGFAGLGPFDFCWAHPPYWRMKRYSDDPRDLSAAPTLDAFLDRYAAFLANCSDVLRPKGKLAVLMGDLQDRELGFVPLVYHAKRLAFAAGFRQACTDIIRFSHGTSSSAKVYRGAFIPGLHDVCTVFERL